MIKPEQVPDAVWSAFHEAVLRYGYKPQAIAAALNAWPGMKRPNRMIWGEARSKDIILPFVEPQEASDEPHP